MDDVDPLDGDAEVGDEVAAGRLGDGDHAAGAPHRGVQQPVRDPGAQLLGPHEGDHVVHGHHRRHPRPQRQAIHRQRPEQIRPAAPQGDGQHQLVGEVGEPLGHRSARQPDHVRGGVDVPRRRAVAGAPLAQDGQLAAALGGHRGQLGHEARGVAPDAPAAQEGNVDGASVDDDAQRHGRRDGVSGAARRAWASSVSRSSGGPPAARTEISSKPKLSSSDRSEVGV